MENQHSRTEHFPVQTPDGLTLAAQAQGSPDAPEILFVHGLGQCHLSWTQQVDASDLAGCRLVTFDLRGHGGSDKPLDEAAYSDRTRWADDLAAVITATGLRRPMLVGWSIGGTIILHYLERHGGENIAGINLVNAVTTSDPDLVSSEAHDLLVRLAAEDLGVRTAACAAFLEACFANPPAKEDFARMLVFNGMVPRAVHQGIFNIVTEGLDKTLVGFNGPLIVTHGEKDRLLRPAMSERVRRVNPRASLSFYPQAGHSPFYEAPSRFNQELIALLGEVA